jgi:hypothetical protein
VGSVRTHGDHHAHKPLELAADHKSIEELREENRELKELVVQLSKLVIRNALDRR